MVELVQTDRNDARFLETVTAPLPPQAELLHVYPNLFSSEVLAEAGMVDEFHNGAVSGDPAPDGTATAGSESASAAITPGVPNLTSPKSGKPNSVGAQPTGAGTGAESPNLSNRAIGSDSDTKTNDGANAAGPVFAARSTSSAAMAGVPSLLAMKQPPRGLRPGGAMSGSKPALFMRSQTAASLQAAANATAGSVVSPVAGGAVATKFGQLDAAAEIAAGRSGSGVRGAWPPGSGATSSPLPAVAVVQKDFSKVFVCESWASDAHAGIQDLVLNMGEWSKSASGAPTFLEPGDVVELTQPMYDTVANVSIVVSGLEMQQEMVHPLRRVFGVTSRFD